MSQRMTENEGGYLKLIHRRQVEEDRELGTTEIAEIFNVQPATVTEVLQKLAYKNLVVYQPYRGVQLTEPGLQEAKELLRGHRLLEILPVNHLRYGVQEACREASRLDHHTSKKMVNKISEAYDHPKLCPCNKTVFADKVCRAYSDDFGKPE